MMPRSSVHDVLQTATRPGSILVIDDEEIMREILETLLTREGYEVRLAASAADASQHEGGFKAASRCPRGALERWLRVFELSGVVKREATL